MKLKNSEKQLLIVLVIALAAYFFFTYLFFPLIDQNALIKAEFADADNNYQTLLKSHLTNNQLKEVLSKATSKYQSLETLLPPQIHQEEAILYLTDLASKNEMQVDSYNFAFADTAKSATNDSNSTIQKAPVDDVLKEFQKVINGDQTANLSQFKDKIYQTPNEKGTILEQYAKDLKYFNVSITLKGNYTKFKNYIASLEAYKSKIIIKQINLSKSTDATDEVIGSITISYPIYFDQENLKPYDWKFDKPLINKNPFEYEVFKLQTVPTTATGITPSGEIIIPNTEEVIPTEVKPVEQYKAADFYMVLKPANSDANTLTIGKSPHRYTALYVDNDGVENATLRVRKAGGKYEYQYATSLQTYPGDNDWNEFTPMENGKLVLEVLSTERLPQNDQSGALLSIYNDSGLSLTVYVSHDDPERPRLKVNKASGKITVKLI